MTESKHTDTKPSQSSETSAKEGYKKTKLGWIPIEWELEKLGKLFEFRNGVNASKEDYGQGIKFVNVRDVLENTFITEEKILGSVQLTDKKIKKNLVKKGDVLFNRTSETQDEIGLTALYYDNAKAVFGGFVIRGRPKNNSLNHKFNGYSFHSELVRKQIISKGQGAVRVNIGQSDLEKVLLPLPPLPEQKKIAETLSTWDRAISILEQLLKAKKCYKKGLMQQLLSGKKRFPEFVKSEDTFETRFGVYPKDWRYPKIRRFAKEVKHKNGSESSDYTVLSCTKYDGLVNSLEYFDRQVFSDDLSNYKVVKKGEFAYATNHIEEGSIGYNDWCEKGLISPMYTVFSTDQEKINDRFLYNLFKTEKYRHIFEVNTNGTVNRRGSLRWKGFSNIRVPLPSREEQDEIAEVLQNADHEISLLKKKLQALKKQKKGLMQQLLTGKIRVNKIIQTSGV